MGPDIDNIRFLFTHNVLNRYFKLVLILIGIIFILEVYSTYRIINNEFTKYEKRLDSIINNYNGDIGLLCDVLSCSMIEKNDITYKKIDSRLIPVNNKIPSITYLHYYTKDFDIVYKYKDITFLIPNEKYIYIFMDLLTLKSIIFTLIFSIAFFSYEYNRKKASIIEKSSYKSELETKLQRDLSESIHHELLAPISIIKTLLMDINNKVYLHNGRDEKMIFDIDEEPNDNKKYNRRKIDKIYSMYYEKMMMNINAIETVLDHIAENKHIKYSNGNISIYKILTNVVGNINVLNVKKIYAIYENEDLLKKYAVNSKLSNGGLLLIINNHIRNSMDAKATNILFKVVKVENDVMNILIADNGIGIRDYKGNIISTDEIFKSGYTTKDSEGNHIYYKNMFLNLLIKLGITKKEKIPRGIGLFINKKILNEVGGDIELLSTSEKGTIFSLYIPIKKRMDD